MENLEVQKKYFSAITKDREESATTFEKSSMEGAKDAVVDKYSDQAHFIYELLQNADDAKAEKARFSLTSEGLTFIHNGTIKFTASNPDSLTEKEDRKQRKLGHINAITSIGQSAKDKATIGKFGVGFKAIFQYSNTPHIYDDNFRFKIERFFVPKELFNDHKDRKNAETLFYFPFDRKEIEKETAFEDILQKLKSLTHPTLFLNNLDEVVWETENENGVYAKNIKEGLHSNDIECQLISLVENKDNKKNEKDLWLFTRKFTEGDIDYKYSIGFFLNNSLKLDSSTNYPAFCFFPTKETTNLKFVIQAPFLLTDSREGIKAGVKWNEDLVDKLSYLSADSLPILKEIGIRNNAFLIDDSLVNLIPYKKSDFTNLGDRNRISFLPFYNAIQKKLQVEELLPGKNGSYSSKIFSYWASETELTDLFSDIQIADLMEKQGAKWVFPTIGWNVLSSSNRDLVNYIDGGNEIRKIPSNLIVSNLDSDKLLRRVTASFIEKQSFDWLNKFYLYIYGKKSYQDIIKKKPIFINGDLRALPAFNDSNKLILFLPSDTETEYPTIHKDFLNYPKAIEFFKTLEIGYPSLKDEIYNKILPQYNGSFESYSNKILIHFESFLNYYESCKASAQTEFLADLKRINFIAARNESKPENCWICNPSKVYFNVDHLKMYFSNSPATYFLDENYYIKYINGAKKDLFFKFLSDLGLSYYPRVIEISENVTYETKKKFEIEKYAVSQTYSNKQIVIDKKLDGLDEALKGITLNLSVIIWKYLLEFANGKTISTFNTYLQGDFKYIPKGYGEWSFSYKKFNSSLAKTLQMYVLLLFDKNEKRFVEKTNLEHTIQELNDAYDIKHPFATVLLGYLGINDPDANLNLNDTDKQALTYGRKLLDEGITEDEFAQMIATRKNTFSNSKTEGNTKNAANGASNENTEDESNENEGEEFTEQQGKKSQGIPKPFVPKSVAEVESEEDEFMPVMDDPNKIKNNLQEQEEKNENEYQNKKDIIRKRVEYEETARNSEMYSFGWFKALLELEDSFTLEDRVKKNPIRVVFNTAKIDTDGTLLLEDTPYIPQTIEDMGELKITFYFGNEVEDKKTIIAEAVSPQKTTLKAKLKIADALDGFDFSKINRVVVEVSSADFILENLKIAFYGLEGFKDTDNLHTLLPPSLNFVFGPPGTGKTTYLSWMIGGLNPIPLTFAGTPVTPLMEQGNKVLVLTPTNKAADVLAEKIIENYFKNKQYPEWLMRFGETKSDVIMNSSFFIKDKKVRSTIYNKCTLITTIARFPYDKFFVERKNNDVDTWAIKNFHWDYIVFDEASMISLASIIYVIYQAKKVNSTVKFIIGGDPFQIHPIIKFKWLGWSFIPEPAFNPDGSPKLDTEGKQISYNQDAGNIYSMVGLNSDRSFIHPQTTPHPFIVHNLVKQYRSIEPIGALFSHYRYHGKLLHDRINEEILINSEKAIKEIAINNLPLKPITLIHFPVKKYDINYRSRSVKGSPYHIYSAIFVVELLKYIQANAEIDKNAEYKIGVICPYKIQETIINKLIEPCKGKIEIITGTVHGFQGDQCDMVITVLNPPTKITRSTRSFLNKKNILNVAISRAKDCLIILVPESNDKDVNIADLHQVERIKNKVRELPEIKGHYIEYKSEVLEQTIFKNSNIKIENFAFVTAHQNVNVYADTKRKYEVRVDENAIDIQYTNS